VAPSRDNLTPPLVSEKVIDRSNGLMRKATERVTIEITEIWVGYYKFTLEMGERVVSIKF
jgi:hypothetical protein